MGERRARAFEYATASVAELLGQHSLVETVVGVEHQIKRYIAGFFDLYAGDAARLVMVCDGADRAFVGFQNFYGDVRLIGQKRTAPSSRPKWADGR